MGISLRRFTWGKKIEASSQIIPDLHNTGAHDTGCVIDNNEIEIVYLLIYFISLLPMRLFHFSMQSN
jgi:hypothetical protein